MSIPTDTVWELRTAGSDTVCGGGWSTSNKGATGVDYSQQNAAQYTYTTDLSGSGTTTLTSAGAHFTNDILGNIINISGQGFYCVTAFTNASTVTVDRALGTFSNGTGNVGGALATPGQVGALATAGNSTYVKNGTYTCSSTNNVAGGRVTTPSSSTNRWEGYQTSRGDLGSPPTLQAASNSMTIFTLTGGWAINIIFDGHSGTNTNTTGIANAGASLGSRAWLCQAINCATAGFSEGGDIFFMHECYANNCGTGFSIGNGNKQNVCFMCVAKSCTTGYGNGPGYCNRCFAIACTTGWNPASNEIDCDFCVAYGTTNSTGFQAASGSRYVSCVATNNTGTGKGFNVGSTTYLNKCAGYNNNTNVSGSAGWNVGFITLTADPFTNAGGNDFSLNTTAGGGASLRGAGYPGSFNQLSSTTAPDVGAVQTNVTTAGGAVLVGHGSILVRAA